MSTSSSSKEELGPKSRTRSSSATESSKPIARRQTHSGMSKYHTQGNILYNIVCTIFLII